MHASTFTTVSVLLASLLYTTEPAHAQRSERSPRVSQLELAVQRLKDQMAGLQEMVATLEQRVHHLEARSVLDAPRAEASQESVSLPEHNDLVVRVHRLDTFIPDDAARQREVDALERSIDDLEKQIRDREKRIQRARDRRTRKDRPYDDDDNLFSRDERRRDYTLRQQIKKLSREQREDQAEIDRTEGAIRRVTRALAEPRQRIHGTDGERAIILETTRDISRQLHKVAPGDCVAFSRSAARKTASTGREERWDVRSVRRVECPEKTAVAGK